VVLKTDVIPYESFYRWWSSGPSAKLNNRTTKLDKLTAEVREETIPWIKHLFAGADEDESGELDAEEFRKFYPNLVEYLEENTGQVMSSVEDCMAEIDAESTAGKGNGTIEYEEFELWFIRQELKRAKEDAKKADQVKRKRNSMSSIMTIFGEPAIQEKQKPVKKRTSIKEKYNYGDVQNDPVDLFHKYDVDESGELDAEELTEMMFELGIKLSDENMAAAKKALGITEDEGVDLWTFESWWNDNFAKQKKVREQMLAKVSADMRENYLPHIRKLFAGADKDKNGSLDKMEFEQFYPKLKAYLGYKLQPIVHTMNEIDSMSYNGGVYGNGMIEYEEFETWFLQKEMDRAKAMA